MDLRQRIGLRIKEARKAAHFTLDSVETKTDGRLKKSRIGNWEQGRTMPGPEEVTLLGELLDVSPAYLLCLSEVNTPELDSAANGCPLLTQADKSLLNHLPIKIPSDGDFEQLMLCKKLSTQVSNETFAYELNDNSMAPKALMGDIIIVDPKQAPMPQQGVLAYFAKNDSLLFRKYVSKEINDSGEDVFELIPLNNDWPTISTSDHDKVTILGTVVQIITFIL